MATVSLLRLPAFFKSLSTTPTATNGPFLTSFPPRSPLFVSSPSEPLLSLAKKHPLTPFVASTSEWAQQEEEEEKLGWGSEGSYDVEVSSDGFVEESYPEPPEEAKLFVGNLPFDIDSTGLANLFEQAGIVEIAEVIYNRKTNESRGFGFVSMRTVEEAEKAVELFNGYDYNGRVLNVNKAGPRGTRAERPPREYGPLTKIYVGNLPWQVDDDQLAKVFSKHGTIVSVRVVRDRETGRSRGFGFVAMSTEADAGNAIAALDGQSLDGRTIIVKIAEERPPRRAF